MAGACDSGGRQKYLIRNRLITRNIMAIQQRIVNDSLTEIYVNGGGNFITQSRPTNFHQFFTRKILTPTEDISDFREVTAAERTALEQADALWEEPPRSFIDLWNAACGTYGRYNPETGFFELNGITDLTITEAEEILLYYTRRTFNSLYYAHHKSNTRTFIPPKTPSTKVSMQMFCANSGRLEKVVFSENVVGSDMYAAFAGCRRLREIQGVIIAPYANYSAAFNSCERLEEVRIQRLGHSVSFKDSSNLSFESISYMIENATNTAAITITLHPTAYARVTDELFAQAAAKNITIATT